MKHNILSRKTTCLLTLIVIMLLAWGCSDKLVDNNTNPTTVKLETSISLGQLADVISVFRLTVTGPGMEPIVVIQFYEGGPLVFELDIPAGPSRVFVLEGFVAEVEVSSGEPIYKGTAVVDIEPNVAVNLTLHMQPVVPLVRLTPLETVVTSGQSFSVNLEVHNLLNLIETELLIQYDASLITFDSVVRGSGLDATDVLDSVAGSDPPGLQLHIYDPDEGPTELIVDETGYSHLATLHFTSNIEIEATVTALEILGLSYIGSGGARFLPGEVFSHAATVEITRFAGALLRFLPSDTAVQPESTVRLRLEAHNLQTLYQAEMWVEYDDMVLRYDSIVKGGNLTANDTVIVSEASTAGALNVTVVDTNFIAGSIVDAAGYSHMATVYFTAMMPPQTAITEVEIIPIELLASVSVGGSIPVSSVTAEGATVTVSAITNLLMSFWPNPPDPLSSESFTIDVELFNMANLDSIEFGFSYDTSLVRYISFSKGRTLDVSDAVLQGETGAAERLFLVEDTMGGVIVDQLGYSNLITFYFRTRYTPDPKPTVLEPNPIGFYLITGDSIRVVDVALADATLNIGPFPDEEIFFEDPNLEGLVRNVINYPSGPIMWSQVYDLTNLNGGEASIASLGGIEKLVSLTYLSLPYSVISDLAPLQELTALSSLDLSGNEVVDVSPLASMTNISYLNLSDNDISDISPLVDGTVLGYNDYLDLSYNFLLTAEACADVLILQSRGVYVDVYGTPCEPSR